jgi:uncharacterized protein DUF5329
MIVRRTRHALLAAAASLAFSHVSFAGDDAVAKNEIDHLLNFIGTSSCTFVRNGTEYTADKAREHLAGKYRFVGTRISTADDFIKYLGTGSSMSGEPYYVKCGKTDLPSGVWLGDELARYRKAARNQAAR